MGVHRAIDSKESRKLNLVTRKSKTIKEGTIGASGTSYFCPGILGT
jgi:hypothetical protein